MGTIQWLSYQSWLSSPGRQVQVCAAFLLLTMTFVTGETEVTGCKHRVLQTRWSSAAQVGRTVMSYKIERCCSQWLQIDKVMLGCHIWLIKTTQLCHFPLRRLIRSNDWLWHIAGITVMLSTNLDAIVKGAIWDLKTGVVLFANDSF